MLPDVSSPSEQGPLTAVEAGVLTLTLPLAAVVVVSYLLDLAGVAFGPFLMLVVALLVAGGTAVALGRRSSSRPGEGGIAVALGLGVGMWLLWLAAPTFLPLSTGPDLTHHLLLIRYIEQHWRLVHDPAIERFLGEMAQYTPGSHVLVALAGAWSRTDGLRAMHAVQVFTVALKVVLLFAVCLRLLPPRAPRVIALVGPVLLLASPRYFLGGFTEYGFLAQVVAELFVVAMWWSMVAWSQAKLPMLLAVFGLAGAATFLSWPVYSGPPCLAALLVIGTAGGRPFRQRFADAATAFSTIGLIALIYIAGRLGWLQLAGTGGSAPWPAVDAFGWPFIALACAGVVLSVWTTRGRASGLFVVAVLAQAGAFYVLARRAGAPQPYMTLKMVYLLLWPMAACAALAAGELWVRVVPASLADRSSWRFGAALAVALAFVAVARPLAAKPARLHPLPPAVSLPLYEAGQWAHDHVPPGCVEYLVGDDETAYWLHLAVLGNPRMSDRTGDNSTYEPTDAILRWLTPGGLPYAIVDLPVIPRDVREELDIVQAFGTAAVAKRRGPASCDLKR